VLDFGVFGGFAFSLGGGDGAGATLVSGMGFNAGVVGFGDAAELVGLWFVHFSPHLQDFLHFLPAAVD
jgi:hypothetical protein